jgi:hypothetical protein
MTKIVLMAGATLGKVYDAVHHPGANLWARPSHSDDLCNALGAIGFDAASLLNTCDDMTMKP